MFDARALARQVEGLPSELRVAYVLLVAERLYPALAAYSRETVGDEALRVRGYLDEVWDALEWGRLGSERLHEIADDLVELRPETEDNPSQLSSYALDAVTAAWEAIQVALTDDVSHVAAAAQIAFDSVFMYAEEREDFRAQEAADRRAILAREVVTAELDAQAVQLQRARDLVAMPRVGAKVLRQEFGHPVRSSHGLS